MMSFGEKKILVAVRRRRRPHHYHLHITGWMADGDVYQQHYIELLLVEISV